VGPATGTGHHDRPEASLTQAAITRRRSGGQIVPMLPVRRTGSVERVPGTVGRKAEGVGMNFNTPDQDVDAAKLRAQDIQRARQRSQPAKSRKPGRVRLLLRRILGRENPPASP
jgi:hypothetical protein